MDQSWADADAPPMGPSGTVTLLFTDIVGSTAMWEAYPDEMAVARLHHFCLLKEAVASQEGLLFKTVGDGGCAAFASAPSAVTAAFAFQRMLKAATWPDGIVMGVRAAVHSGTVAWEDGDYVGRPVNRVARLVRLAEGGQILVSSATAKLIDSLPTGCSLEAGGVAALRGFAEEEEYLQLVHGDLVVTELRRATSAKSNLLPLPFAFVGRAAELGDLRRKLLDRQERLVTLTGMGGVGKSTLGRQLAMECLPFFPDGVWFVECDGLSSAQEVLGSITSTIGIPGSEDALREHLASAQTLIVLDCFERLVDVAPQVGDWIAHAPHARFLVTSRCVLGLPLEFEYPVGPMAKGQRVLGDALALFAYSASHVIDGFEVNAANRKSIREICETLEGVPLAIVLASARLRTMTLSELAESLRRKKLALLKRRQVGNDRHADLQAVIAESISLLEGPDVVLLKRLSAFAGGFTLRDAEEVLHVDSLHDGIENLRGHSILSHQIQGDRLRFRLLDTVREYLEGFAVAIPAEDDERFRARYLQVAIEIDGLLASGNWSGASQLLWRELPNMRRSWRIDTSNDCVVEFARALGRPLFELGIWDAFDELFRLAYARAEDRHPQLFMKLLGLRGAHLRRQGHESEATELWTRRLAAAECIGDVRVQVDAHVDLAQQSLELGHLDQSRRHAIRAIRMARGKNLAPYLVSANGVLALWAARAGRSEHEIRRRLEELEDMVSSVSEVDAQCFALVQIADAYHELGKPDEGRAVSVAALKMATQAQFVYGVGWILLRVFEREDDPERKMKAAMALRKLPVDAASNVKRAITAKLKGFVTIDSTDKSWDKLALDLTKQ